MPVVPAVGSAVSQPEALLTEDVLPVIDSIVRRRCRGDLVSIRDEVRGEVIVRLLRRFRMAPPEEIHSVRDYAAAVTWRVIDDLMRRRFPRRTQLKNRIRYLLRHDRRFVCTIEDEGTLCSLAPDSSRRSDRHSAEIEDLARLVSAVLQRRTPCEIDELVGEVADELGISDAQVQTDDAGLVTAEMETPLSRAEAIDNARFLWKEIVDLPPKQRLALLLSMRDERGESPLVLLPQLAIASIEDIADSLRLVRHDFESMLNRLPLQDSEIAVMLAMTRQQVINLRKAARDRLRRRFARQRGRATEH
jgi:RNA polymerase sigma factor (sigma-70 family)